MYYYDQHVHSQYSFDSKEKLANYMKKAGDDFITTEHLEFNNPDNKNHDSIPDYTAYVTEIEQLKKQTGKNIYKGIEIGMSASQLDNIRDYLAHHQFDLKLLSFHQNGQFDYMDDIIAHLNPIKVTKDYYQMMLDGIKLFHDADVLAHFDYGVRLLNLTSGQFATTAGVLLTDVFKIAIENDMALELNTKSMFKYHNIGLYDYGIELYKQLGGNKFTIGSDAHEASDYGKHFDDAKEVLINHDIHKLVVYIGNKSVEITL